MQHLISTFILAFIVILIAIILLSIGFLITGKTKLKRMTCGRNPDKERDQSCGTSSHCALCGDCDNKNIQDEEKNDTSN